MQSCKLFSEKKVSFSFSPFIGSSLPYYGKSTFDKPYFKLRTKVVYGVNVFSHCKISDKFTCNFGFSVSKLAYGFNAVKFSDNDVILGVKQTINMQFFRVLFGLNYNFNKNSIGINPFIAFGKITKYKGGGPTPYSSSNEAISYKEGGEYFFDEIKNPYYGFQLNYSRLISKRISFFVAYDYFNFSDGVVNYHVEITKASGNKKLSGTARARIDMASFGVIYKLK